MYICIYISIYMYEFDVWIHRDFGPESSQNGLQAERWSVGALFGRPKKKAMLANKTPKEYYVM